MLSLRSQAWFFTFCVCCFATISLQAQTNGSTNSTQEKSSEHSLIANYSTSTENTYNFGGYDGNYLYNLGINPASAPQEVSPSNHSQSNSETPYPTETASDSQDFGFSSFVDEILDIPNEDNTRPQYRVVPVATVEDIHGISTKEKLDRYNNGITNENFNPDNTPTTRVVPVATVEDIHGISTKERLDRYNNGVTNENFNPDNTPTTRVVPVATVEDIHEIGNTRDQNAYQPYRSSNPVVQPSRVKTESSRERKQRYSTYSSNRYTGSYPSSERNTDYSTINTRPRPKKSSFGEFIKRAFNIEQEPSPSYRNNDYSERSNRNEKEYRSERSSPSSREYNSTSGSNSSKTEYSQGKRESRKTDSNNTAKRSNRNQ